MKLHESGENYLETILLLQKRNGNVRSIDIANELGFSKPSISRAMSILKKAEYITMEESGLIHLTPLGLKKAKQVYERHEYITEFLISCLSIDAQTAEKDACRIEHILSESTFQKIKDYVHEHSPEAFPDENDN